MEIFEVTYNGEKEKVKKTDKVDIPASTISELRKHKLATTLKLLGYPDINDIDSELDDSKIYLALGRIGKQLENYINLGAYVHHEGKENDEDIVRVHIPEGMTREEFLEIAKPVRNEWSSDIEFIKEQDEKRTAKRTLLHDYYTNMSSKIPSNEWIMYSNITRETAALLLELNADLLNNGESSENSDSSRLTGNELADRISKLIDSSNFSKACDIENRFVIRESKRLMKEIDFMLSDSDEMIMKSSVTKALTDIKAEETATIKERGETSSSYNIMQKKFFPNKRQPKDNGSKVNKEEGFGIDD